LRRRRRADSDFHQRGQARPARHPAIAPRGAVCASRLGADSVPRRRPVPLSLGGFLKLELNDEITFETEGLGSSATLKLNGEVVLEAREGKLSGVRSKPVALRSGLIVSIGVSKPARRRR